MATSTIARSALANVLKMFSKSESMDLAQSVGWCFEQHWAEVVAVNDPFIDTKYMAYMFKYDSTRIKVKDEIKVIDESTLDIGGHSIKVFGKMDPPEIPWSSADVYYVVEASGVFTSIDKASAHLKAGAKKVIVILAPFY